MTWYSSFKSLFIEDKKCAFPNCLYEKCLELWYSEKNLAFDILSDYVTVLHLITFFAFTFYVMRKEIQIKRYRRNEAKLFETIRNLTEGSRQAPVAYLVKKYGKKRTLKENKIEKEVDLSEFEDYSSEGMEVELVVIAPPLAVKDDVVLINKSLRGTTKTSEKVYLEPEISEGDEKSDSSSLTDVKKEFYAESKKNRTGYKSEENPKRVEKSKKKRSFVKSKLGMKKNIKFHPQSNKIVDSKFSSVEDVKMNDQKLPEVPEIVISKFASEDKFFTAEEPKTNELAKLFTGDEMLIHPDEGKSELEQHGSESPPRFVRSKTLTLKTSNMCLHQKDDGTSGDFNEKSGKKTVRKKSDMTLGCKNQKDGEIEKTFKTTFNIENKKFDFKFKKNEGPEENIILDKDLLRISKIPVSKFESGESYKTCKEELGKARVEFPRETIPWKALSDKAMEDLMEKKKRAATLKQKKKCPKPKLNHSARLRLMKNLSLPTTPVDQSVCSAPTVGDILTPQSRVASTKDEFNKSD